MKVLVKSVKGEVQSLEAQSTDKIIDIKGMIKDTKAIDVDTQKIIFKGSAVNDENTLQELGYKEGDFLVLMVVKKTVPLDKKIEAENNKVEEKATNKKPASGEDQAEGVDKGVIQ
eukprot:TRINITY_DN836_c0_g2_i9.p1 TRINITY_DN836_c0_g2~~TRINITY_DN836_c0_g2_i9.p1  ORF type:complete len:115 (-),score=26.33 TRINITY_DN836_c0_g2_i9:561-905(-)